MMFNGDIEYAVSRINSTWMYHKDRKRLVYVEYNGSNNWSMSDPETGEWFADQLDSLSFALPNSLGFVNTKDGSDYVMRVPLRRDWRQGLRERQLVTFKAGGSAPVRAEWFRSNVLRLSATINKTFPTYERVLDLVEDGGKQTAFSNCFAVTKMFRLSYKGRKAGRIKPNGLVELDQRFQFVREELTSIIGEEKVANF